MTTSHEPNRPDDLNSGVREGEVPPQTRLVTDTLVYGLGQYGLDLHSLIGVTSKILLFESSRLDRVEVV